MGMADARILRNQHHTDCLISVTSKQSNKKTIKIMFLLSSKTTSKLKLFHLQVRKGLAMPKEPESANCDVLRPKPLRPILAFSSLDFLRKRQKVLLEFVNNWNFEQFSADVLHSHFSKCGPISCIVKNEPSLGVAKITFGDKRSAATAILDFDGTEWMGYELSCKWWTKSQAKIWKRSNFINI